MEKQYQEITFLVGSTIGSAIKQLQEHEGLVCGSFNEHMLYSDIDDVESAYKKITGKTKTEFDEIELKRQEKREQEEEEHKKSIPELIIKWIKNGKSILDEKYHEEWIECVPIRLRDLYHGMELEACLEIVKQLNTGCSLDVAEKTLRDQHHSGMSHAIVCSMIKSFCVRGAEFVNYVQ